MSRPVLLLFFLLGAWSCGTVFMWQTAIQNFSVAEAVASSDHEGLDAAVGDLTPDSLREVVRYQASEVNRLFFTGWAWVQLGLAALSFALAWVSRSGRASLVLIGAMLLITLGLAVYVVPETVRLGRLMDFAADGSQPQAESMFWMLHHTYTSVDMLKFAMGLVATVIACRRATSTTAPA